MTSQEKSASFKRMRTYLKTDLIPYFRRSLLPPDSVPSDGILCSMNGGRER